MSAAEDIYHNGVDKRIHSYDVGMKRFFEMFQVFVVKFERFESFLEVFGIYPVMRDR